VARPAPTEMTGPPAGTMRSLARVLLIACSLLAAVACATAPPPAAKPIGAVADVAGRWTGFVQDSRGAQPVTLTINADGTWEHTSGGAPPIRSSGASQLSAGQLWLRSHVTGRAATATLYEGDGRRLLIVRSDDGRVVQYTAAPR
jgi:hypothetical protein